jgi:hypothetical protein
MCNRMLRYILKYKIKDDYQKSRHRKYTLSLIGYVLSNHYGDCYVL